MDLKSKVDELDGLYSKVKSIYKEAGWRRRNFLTLAKHDEDFNKKVSKLEEEINSNIISLEKEIGMYSKEDDITPHLTLALKTQSYKERFDYGINLNNLGNKMCYGMCGGFGGLMMALKTSESGYPDIGLTALGVLGGFAGSFLMEGFALLTHHYEEKTAIKDRIKDIKREFKRSKKV